MVLLENLAFFLRAFLPSILLPPVGLLWMIVAGLILARRRRRAGFIVIGVAVALLYALATPFVGGQLMGSLEEDLPIVGGEAQAIIVLGGDVDLTPDPLMPAMPGALSLERLAGAAVLARKTNLPVLITGGALATTEPPVADLMAEQFSGAFGLAVKWRENRARNTCENASYSADILRGAGVQRAYLVTHSWHMRRALLSFVDSGYPVIPAPLPSEWRKIDNFGEFLPQTHAWQNSFFALHEWLGMAGYRLGGCPRIPQTP